jgi:outer membrane protein insertion porin family
VYVRRINFKGNARTRDEVLRREMRQLESTWINTAKVERSKTRLERLGYFKEVNVETPAVPGTTDQVDVDFTVEELPSGNLLAGIGFSQTEGLVFSGSVNQENFLGTGLGIGVAANTSDVNTVYSFSFTDPYWTIDGVSRTINLFYRETDAQEANVSDFTTDRFGGGMRFGVPINEFDRVNLGVNAERLELDLGVAPAREIIDFIEEEGDSFDFWTLTASWSRDTRNRAIFPDRGMLQRITGEAAMPGSDLTYYKVTARQDWYHPLTRDYTLLLNAEVAYGDGYGDTERLPFFENFYGGGIRSVRGYEDNTLGPRDSNGDPFGGDLRVTGSAEVILPVPFAEDARSVRVSGFVDGGNVWGPGQDFDSETLRFSAGVSATWISPLGVLTFSLAQPLNDEPDDEVQNFQFTFGSVF